MIGHAKRLRCNRTGSVSVEAALALGLVLIPLLVGLVDLGFALIVRTRLDRAVQAGLYYAWGIAGASTASIKSAASAGYGASTPAATTTASVACYCIAPTGTLSSGVATACNGTCSSGQVLASWVSVTVSASLAFPFPLPGVGSSLGLSSSGTARVQ